MIIIINMNKWATSSEFDTYRLCEQRRFRRAANVQASLRIRTVPPEPPLLAHTSSQSRGTFRQKARSLAPLNGWACAVKICHDGMLEDTNSLQAPHLFVCLGSTSFQQFFSHISNHTFQSPQYGGQHNWSIWPQPCYIMLHRVILSWVLALINIGRLRGYNLIQCLKMEQNPLEPKQSNCTYFLHIAWTIIKIFDGTHTLKWFKFIMYL